MGAQEFILAMIHEQEGKKYKEKRFLKERVGKNIKNCKLSFFCKKSMMHIYEAKNKRKIIITTKFTTYWPNYEQNKSQCTQFFPKKLAFFSKSKAMS